MGRERRGRQADGCFDRAHVREHSGGFTVWYEAGGVVVGVLTHNADEDYDRGEGMIAERRPLPADVTG